MELEDQVCSLELAKRLKELGIKQESLFFWYCDESRDDVSILNRDESFVFGGVGYFTSKFPAFTVAELGEMLPRRYFSNKYVHATDGAYDWECKCKDEIVQALAKTEADARAKMLIYLLENKLVKP